ncbi:PAS domain S-box protein [bacterium]|nr:PAS domain S-box protein [bacterium]
MNRIMCSQGADKQVMFLDDILEDTGLRADIATSDISSLISSNITTDPATTDHLFILNYALTTDVGRISEFIHGLSTVLGQALINCRLSDELKKKDATLQQWTEQVEARIEQGTKKLLEQEFQFHALFEGANDGILVNDADGDVVEANGVVCRFLGYDRNELLRVNWKHIVPSGRYQEIYTIFQNVIAKIHKEPFEFQLRKKDASVIPVEISSRRVWFKGTEVVQSFIRDISLRKKLQQTLLEAKEKYKMLVESSLVGVFIIEKNTVLFVNTMFETITGYSKEEILKMEFQELVLPEDRYRLDEMDELEHGETGDFEIQLLHKDGRRITCDIHSTVVTVDGKRTVLGNVIDVTKEKEFAKQLLESKKMESISTLAGGIAHDFNNLLGGILGYASLILSDMDESNEYYSDIATIAETTKRAAVLTDRLLAFARGGKYQVKEIMVDEVVNDVALILENTAERNIHIETRSDADVWTIRGDREQIHKAVLNLCLNGIEAMENEGILSIDTSNITINANVSRKVFGLPAGDYVRIVVKDTGIGMSESIKSRMFEPFFTTKTYGEGAGLGLAMVYGVIKNHEGAIHVNTSPGKGTSVSIFLPRFEPEEKPVKAATPKKRAIHNRILLIDDEFIIREVGQRMLEKGGYTVITAPNGASGVKIFLEENRMLDLVLLDWMMPGMGGKETSKRLKEINPDVPICFLSGYRTCDKPEMLMLGDRLFIQKPFQTDALLAAIDTMIKQTDTHD